MTFKWSVSCDTAFSGADDIHIDQIVANALPTLISKARNHMDYMRKTNITNGAFSLHTRFHLTGQCTRGPYHYGIGVVRTTLSYDSRLPTPRRSYKNKIQEMLRVDTK